MYFDFCHFFPLTRKCGHFVAIDATLLIFHEYIVQSGKYDATSKQLRLAWCKKQFVDARLQLLFYYWLHNVVIYYRSVNFGYNQHSRMRVSVFSTYNAIQCRQNRAPLDSLEVVTLRNCPYRKYVCCEYMPAAGRFAYTAPKSTTAQCTSIASLSLVGGNKTCMFNWKILQIEAAAYGSVRILHHR